MESLLEESGTDGPRSPLQVDHYSRKAARDNHPDSPCLTEAHGLGRMEKTMMERPRFLKTWAEPPRRPGFALRTVLVLALILAMLFTVVESWLVVTAAPGLRTGPRVVEIPPHRGLFEVARLLDEAGVIRSPVGFSLLAMLRGSARSLKAGEYQIPQGASTFTVLWQLEGGHVLQHNIVFQEGATVAELAHQLETERLAGAEDILPDLRDLLILRTLYIRFNNVKS